MFVSPWQTIFKEVNNKEDRFMEYSFLEEKFIFQRINNRLGTCVTGNGLKVPACSKTALKTVWLKLYQDLKNEGIIGISEIVPNYYGELKSEDEIYLNAGFQCNKKWATYLLDLQRSCDDIFLCLQSGLRRNLRKMLKLNYSMREISEADKILIDFVDIYNIARLREGIPANENLFFDLKSVLNSPVRKYFVLYIDDIPFACQGICYNEDVAVEVVLAIADVAHEKKIYAGDLLKWEIITWCKNKSIKIYDFAGVSPCPINAKERGIRSYKGKWGGRYIEYGVWSKSLSYRYMLWKILSKIKSRIGLFL